MFYGHAPVTAEVGIQWVGFLPSPEFMLLRSAAVRGESSVVPSRSAAVRRGSSVVPGESSVVPSHSLAVRGESSAVRGATTQVLPDRAKGTRKHT